MNEEVEDLIALNPRFDYGRENKVKPLLMLYPSHDCLLYLY